MSRPVMACEPGLSELSPPALQGVDRRVQTTWKGVGLRGLCLVENRRVSALADVAVQHPPVVLVSAVFDPMRGEYGASLVQHLLCERGFDRVYETHYFHRDALGRMEPECVTEDLRTLCETGGEAPIFVVLCGGAPCLLEALLRLKRAGNANAASGVLIAGPGIPGQFHLWGWLVYNALQHPLPHTRRKCASYTGHPHLQGNVKRLSAWYRGTELRRALSNGLASGKNDPPGVPVRVLFFQRDLMSRAGMVRLKRLFGACELPARIPGNHGSIRRSADAERAIAAFCASFIAAPRPETLDTV